MSKQYGIKALLCRSFYNAYERQRLFRARGEAKRVGPLDVGPAREILAGPPACCQRLETQTVFSYQLHIIFPCGRMQTNGLKPSNSSGIRNKRNWELCSKPLPLGLTICLAVLIWAEEMRSAVSHCISLTGAMQGGPSSTLLIRPSGRNWKPSWNASLCHSHCCCAKDKTFFPFAHTHTPPPPPPHLTWPWVFKLASSNFLPATVNCPLWTVLQV